VDRGDLKSLALFMVISAQEFGYEDSALEPPGVLMPGDEATLLRVTSGATNRVSLPECDGSSLSRD
jgi:hypothetical protein